MSAKREKSVAELVERAFEDGYLLGYEAGKSEESLRRSNMQTKWATSKNLINEASVTPAARAATEEAENG